MKTPTSIGQENPFENESRQEDRMLKKEVNKLAFDVMDALYAPILTCSQGRKNIPHNVAENIRLARIIALMKNEELATLEECVVYLSSVSLQAPMDSEWAKICLHIGYKTMFNDLNKNLWEEIGPLKELDDWLQSKLDWLRHELYARRRKILKQRINAS